jgi:hypothetical protein
MPFVLRSPLPHGCRIGRWPHTSTAPAAYSDGTARYVLIGSIALISPAFITTYRTPSGDMAACDVSAPLSGKLRAHARRSLRRRSGRGGADRAPNGERTTLLSIGPLIHGVEWRVAFGSESGRLVFPVPGVMCNGSQRMYTYTATCQKHSSSRPVERAYIRPYPAV